MTANSYTLTYCLALSLALVGCSASAPEPATLGDLDRAANNSATQPAPKTVRNQDNEEVKEAYYRYIQNAPEDDSGRNMALARLADLELADTQRLTDQENYQDDKRFRATLERTIKLLNAALDSSPDAEGNDRKLYQLAKSHDQLGQHERSRSMLARLASEYPSSDLYPETKFRLAEHDFSRGNYMQAEVAYTAALFASQDTGFHERALFKRGWARYKQSLFDEALKDFVAVIHAQGFSGREPVEPDDQAVFDEYFRSLGLAMIHSADTAQLAGKLRTHGMQDLYPAYRAAADILRQQGRFSDAVELLQAFIQAEPAQWSSMLARSQMVSLWRKGGFTRRAMNATKQLHAAYTQHKAALPDDAKTPWREQAQQGMRKQWKSAARYHHARYQEAGDQAAFERAESWYQRYLEHFDGYAQQDGIALAYADLLAEAERPVQALQQYERAAFDGELILNAEAAYASIALLHELTQEQPGDSPSSNNRMDRYIQYTRAFARLYPTDERVSDMALSAAQRCFHRERYPAAIEFSRAALTQVEGQDRQQAQKLLLQSYLNHGDYAQAEQAALQLASLPGLPDKARKQSQELLGLSIFRQAEAAEDREDWNHAIRHYRRIHEMAPATENAARGLYNALALAAEQDMWPRAIALMERFQQQFPDHKHRADVERRLSQAYLATGQEEQAAHQYEQLAESENDEKAQRAAQWKAAELYREQNDLEKAINAYRRYAHRYPTPYSQNAEAMHNLIGFYEQTGEDQKRRFWERKLLQTDRSRSPEQKNQRTSLLAARAALSLGQHYLRSFEQTRLSLPLDQSLAEKTEHMQNAVEHFATAASYGFTEIASEATHRIGRIYETLARDLLDSDRPSDLNEEQLVQYNILLEDRAFPFEDKAIEFYERNLTRAQEEGFTDWMARSRARLAVLFPVRYDRNPKAGLHPIDQPVAGANANDTRAEEQ